MLRVCLSLNLGTGLRRKRLLDMGYAIGVALAVVFTVVALSQCSQTLPNFSYVGMLDGCKVYHHNHGHSGSSFAVCK